MQRVAMIGIPRRTSRRGSPPTTQEKTMEIVQLIAPFPITVRYWLGTLRLTGRATTLRGAERIAARNQNALPPTFYDDDGRQLHPFYDDGRLVGFLAD